MTLNAVVVGGGIGGVAAALALSRAGIGVRVYEQAAELTEVGAGVSLAPNGLRMLERLGAGGGGPRVGARPPSGPAPACEGGAGKATPPPSSPAPARIGESTAPTCSGYSRSG